MNPLLIEAVALYWPIVTALILVFVFGVTRRELLGLLYATLWNLATLPLLNGIAEASGWWFFETQSPTLGGLPLSLWIGWAALWGGVFCLLSKHIPIALLLLVAGLLDWWTMPKMAPVLQLDSNWLMGELLLIIGSLLPALLLFRWTALQRNLALRTSLISTGFALLSLVVIPLAVHQGSWTRLFLKIQEHHLAVTTSVAAFATLLSFPPALAVREFVVVGKGTPVPMDAPSQLVTTGIYAHIRNPMQFGIISLTSLQALYFWNLWLGLAALSFLFYSIGFARWSEDQDMRARFGSEWEKYRDEVPNWRFRRR